MKENIIIKTILGIEITAIIEIIVASVLAIMIFSIIASGATIQPTRKPGEIIFEKEPNKIV